MKANVGTTSYYPEMGDRKPLAEIEARFSAISGKYRVTTPLELKGRGIKLHDTYTEDNSTDSRRLGWKIYYVTQLAFDKLEKEYAISFELLLD